VCGGGAASEGHRGPGVPLAPSVVTTHSVPSLNGQRRQGLCCDAAVFPENQIRSGAGPLVSADGDVLLPSGMAVNAAAGQCQESALV